MGLVEVCIRGKFQKHFTDLPMQSLMYYVCAQPCHQKVYHACEPINFYSTIIMLHNVVCPKTLLSLFIAADYSTHADIKHVWIEGSLMYGDNVNDNNDEIFPDIVSAPIFPHN